MADTATTGITAIAVATIRATTIATAMIGIAARVPLTVRIDTAHAAVRVVSRDDRVRERT
jgi:hypothetical protein